MIRRPFANVHDPKVTYRLFSLIWSKSMSKKQMSLNTRRLGLRCTACGNADYFLEIMDYESQRCEWRLGIHSPRRRCGTGISLPRVRTSRQASIARSKQMNAALITDDVHTSLRKRYGKPAQISKGQVFTFGSAITCSINYSKLLGGHKYFYAVPSAMVDLTTNFPKTEFGEYALFICGSADKVLVIPRHIIIEMLKNVPTRRVDIFNEGNSLILQTTKHPKLNVTEFLNAYPSTKQPVGEGADPPQEGIEVTRLHVKIQWSLIKLGQAEGCSVWVPINDRNLSYERTPFSTNTLDRLPNFGFEENTRRIVQNIDVLWLKKNVIRRAFEVEATTSIYSGILRLNDLVLSQPNNHIELYIATAQSRKPRVYDQLVRPSFHQLLPACKFISFESIEEQTKRLESLGAGKGIQVSGLVEGERFHVPDHLVYPSNV